MRVELNQSGNELSINLNGNYSVLVANLLNKILILIPDKLTEDESVVAKKLLDEITYFVPEFEVEKDILLN